MGPAGSDTDFWVKFFALMALIILMITGFNAIMRKILNVKRRKIFGNDYVNDIHKKGDIFFRTAMVIAVIAVSPFVLRSPLSGLWVTMIFITLNEVFRAAIEWKYKKETNDYLYTTFQIIFLVTVVYVTIDSGGFGMFDFAL